MTYGNPFVSETLVKSVYSGSGIEQEDKNEVTLLLVARGSSDPEVLKDINWIASLFQTEEIKSRSLLLLGCRAEI